MKKTVFLLCILAFMYLLYRTISQTPVEAAIYFTKKLHEGNYEAAREQIDDTDKEMFNIFILQSPIKEAQRDPIDLVGKVDSIVSDIAYVTLTNNFNQKKTKMKLKKRIVGWGILFK
ncbi:hypothetical protein [Chryseobacterium sp. JK1]|uniref:hypothetical protein n=1 Tax=Chryseobacterium sp. JK1 TaxID=874294 RepID=UPI003D680430